MEDQKIKWWWEEPYKQPRSWVDFTYAGVLLSLSIVCFLFGITVGYIAALK